MFRLFCCLLWFSWLLGFFILSLIIIRILKLMGLCMIISLEWERKVYLLLLGLHFFPMLASVILPVLLKKLKILKYAINVEFGTCYREICRFLLFFRFLLLLSFIFVLL